MTKKTRLIILLICAGLFLTVTPYVLLHSLGYKIDIKSLKITSTGGIYLKVWPPGANIILNKKGAGKTSIFSNSLFIRNLLPKEHHILINKEGYYEYQKTLTVFKKTVTKLENVNLIKKTIPFEIIERGVQYVYLTPNQNNFLFANIKEGKVDFQTINLINGQRRQFFITTNATDIADLFWSRDSSRAIIKLANDYFLIEPFLQIPKITPFPFLRQAEQISFNSQNADQIYFIKNKNLFSNKQTAALLQNVAAYTISGNEIIWLDFNGFLYKANLESITFSAKKNLFPLAMKTGLSYQILLISNKIFLKENNFLMVLDEKNGKFDSFHNSIKEVKLSPDGQKILYYNDHEIFVSFIDNDFLNPASKIFLNRYSEKINDVWWLGSHYVIFTLKNKIIISEIDNRGNINIIQLPDTVSLPANQTVALENPFIFFNQQDKKLYILNNNQFISSERLIQ